MKIIFLLSTSLLYFLVAQAADTTNKNPILNIYFERSTGVAFYMKLPNRHIIHLDRKNHFTLNRKYRQFTQIQVVDTGILKVFLFDGQGHWPWFPLKSEIPENAFLASLHLKEKKEFWLHITQVRWKNSFTNGINYLSTEEFKTQHPKAYRRFLKRGFTHVISNVAVNTVPLRKEPY
jgi:hypothetical protein